MKDMMLTAALAKAQAEMTNAAMTKTNPHFKSKYAPLDAIRDAVVPVLAKHGIAITQTTGFEGDMFGLRTSLRMGDEEITGFYPVTIEKPQQMGSALTYARRYTLAAMCGIASEEDDDGNAAQEGGPKRKTAAQAKRDGDYERLQGKLEGCQNMGELQAAWKATFAELPALPKTFETELTAVKDAMKASLSQAPADAKTKAADHKDEILLQLQDCMNTDAITELEATYAQELGDMENDHPDMHAVVMDEIEKAKALYSKGKAA